MSLQWIVCHRQATAPCICTLKSLTVSSLLLFLFFSLLSTRAEKGPCRCSLGFYVKSYLTDMRKCQPNPKVTKKKHKRKQPDYFFLWKVTCDTVSRECKINLWNMRCAQAGLSPLSLKEKQLAEDMLNFSRVLSFAPRNSTATAPHHNTFVMPSQLAYAGLQRPALCSRHKIWCLHQADCLHASHFVSLHRWPPCSLAQAMEDVRRLLSMDCILNSWERCFSLAGWAALHKNIGRWRRLALCIGAAPREKVPPAISSCAHVCLCKKKIAKLR